MVKEHLKWAWGWALAVLGTMYLGSFWVDSLGLGWFRQPGRGRILIETKQRVHPNCIWLSSVQLVLGRAWMLLLGLYSHHKPRPLHKCQHSLIRNQDHSQSPSQWRNMIRIGPVSTSLASGTWTQCHRLLSFCRSSWAKMTVERWLYWSPEGICLMSLQWKGS